MNSLHPPSHPRDLGLNRECTGTVKTEVFQAEVVARAFHLSGLANQVREFWLGLFSLNDCPVCNTDGKVLSHQGSHAEAMSQLIAYLSAVSSVPPSFSCGTPLENLELSFHDLRFDSPPFDPTYISDLLWMVRTLCRNRDNMAADKSSCLSFEIDEYKVEMLFPFDFHMIRHIACGGDNVFLHGLQTMSWASPLGGKSSSRFAVSSDGQFILKFINRKEEEQLRKLGPVYVWYLMNVLAHSIPSLITPMYGAFSVINRKTKHRDTFVILRNISALGSVVLFDLKGVGPERSIRKTLSRTEKNDADDLSFVSNRSNLGYGAESSARVLWDQDFREIFGEHSLALNSDNFFFLDKALKNDTKFLSALQVVDYSLFLSMRCEGQGYNIEAGLIDYLRPFTWEKKIESVVKSMNSSIVNLGFKITDASYSWTDPGGVAAKKPDMAVAPTVIRPELYARRFRLNIVDFFKSSEDEQAPRPI